MGGVDLNDMLVAIYRTDVGTKRYYFRIFYELLDVAIVNSWLLYRKYCERTNVEKRCIKSLLTFKSEIAHVLLSANISKPNNTSAQENPSPPRIKMQKTADPSLDIRYDQICHLPKYNATKERCRNCNNRTSFSRIKCVKCNVALCITKDKNCFYDFHIKN